MELACTILDGSQFRLGEGPRMTVTQAKFEQKGEVRLPSQPQEIVLEPSYLLCRIHTTLHARRKLLC